jgi:hypothetical protein
MAATTNVEQNTQTEIMSSRSSSLTNCYYLPLGTTLLDVANKAICTLTNIIAAAKK